MNETRPDGLRDPRWHQCPRCAQWFHSWDKYVDHAWKEDSASSSPAR